MLWFIPLIETPCNGQISSKNLQIDFCSLKRTLEGSLTHLRTGSYLLIIFFCTSTNRVPVFYHIQTLQNDLTVC